VLLAGKITVTAPEDETFRLLRRCTYEEVSLHLQGIINSGTYTDGDLNTMTTNKEQLNKILHPYGWAAEEYYKEFGRRLWDRKKTNL